eukprot:gene539-1032_t
MLISPSFGYFICIVVYIINWAKVNALLKSVQSRSNFHPFQLRLKLLPTEVVFQPNQLEILRVLGKIDVIVDKNILDEVKAELQKQGEITPLSDFAQTYGSMQSGRATSVRIFEARLFDGSRCFVKEYLPVGILYGKRELTTSRKFSSQWRTKQNESIEYADMDPPFPTLLGHLRTDNRVTDTLFRSRWIQRFPRTKPPEPGNIWLVFKWDEFSFKSIKLFPPLPQVIEGLDYFMKDKRLAKRWRFIRVVMRRVLETVAFFHINGYCHNAISTESLWISTTNQQELDSVRIKLTDLGVSQRLAELGPYARKGVVEDLYQVGLIFLQFILASFSDDTVGANNARVDITREQNNKNSNTTTSSSNENMFSSLLVAPNASQLTQREVQTYFENYAEEDLPTLRACVMGTKGWEDAAKVLEMDAGAGWKLIFKLLARGRLYDNDREKPIKITASGLIRDSTDVFKDTF